MPIDELKPKETDSGDTWVKAADGLLKKITTEPNLRTSSSGWDRDRYRDLSDKEVDWRAKGMKKKRVEQGVTTLKDGKESKGPNYPEYKKGGVVKKTGLAKVHKGETITPKGKKGGHRLIIMIGIGHKDGHKGGKGIK
jgi:hypothetical protein